MSVANESKGVRAPPALNPEQVAIVQPWKDFLARGLIADMRIHFRPTGVNVEVDLAAHVEVPEGSSRMKLPVGLAREYINSSGLAKAKTKKVDSGSVQPLPVRSLCGRDAEMPEQINARISSVALKLTTTSALGRITSLKMGIEGESKISGWWQKSTPEQKLRVLTDAKTLTSLSAEHKRVLMLAVSKVPCPFRDPEAKSSVVKPATKATGPAKGTQGTVASPKASPGTGTVAGVQQAAKPEGVQPRPTATAQPKQGAAMHGGQARPATPAASSDAGSRAASPLRNVSTAVQKTAGAAVAQKK